MTEALPDPLVPAEVDLRDFAFMPLDCVRLRDSDLAATTSGDEFRCAVLLWCAAWHQVPAASLPDDDGVLANLAGFGRVVREWIKVRDGALKGWIVCSDGRLYHPVVAEKALEAWQGKLAQRWRSECARIKKHNQRHHVDLPVPDLEQWLSQGCPWGHPLPVPRDTGDVSPGQGCIVPRETHSKGQGEGQGQGQDKEKTSSSSSPEPATAKPTVPCPYREIVGAYHDALPTLPKVRIFDGKAWEARCKAMRELWGWVLSSRRADNSRRAESADQALAWVRDYFAMAAKNDFVMGRTTRSEEHKNWRCDIDYLLSTRGLKQVVEKTQEAA